VPLPFLPLDGLSDTHLELFVSARALDPARENREHLPGRRVMASDHAVEAREGHVQVAVRDAGMDEALRREVIDRARREVDPLHATEVKATSMCTPIR
jgi:hypothetical protein